MKLWKLFDKLWKNCDGCSCCDSDGVTPRTSGDRLEEERFKVRTKVARFCWRWEHFFRYIRLGLLFRYPLCCVMNFALGPLFKVQKQAKRRGMVWIYPKYGWVPCRWHQGRHPRWRSYSAGNPFKKSVFWSELTEDRRIELEYCGRAVLHGEAFADRWRKEQYK